jgi:glutamine cyclotransferase
MNRFYIFFFLLSGILITGCNNSDIPGITTSTKEDKTVFIPDNLSYQVIAEFPHDTGAYTQGLIWYNGHLLEGTGQFGESNLRVVDLQTGKVVKQVTNKEDIFGEGITLLGNKIYQITWQNKKGYVYDANSLKMLKEFSLNTDGWGLTNNGKELIYSDGSSNLYFLDTTNFRELNRVSVTDNFGPVGNLNELEWIEGSVFANRYQTDIIYRIDPENGRVTGKIDLGNLKGTAGIQVKDVYNEVLNGIAYDSATGRIFITGKYWSKMFEIKIGN